MYLKKSIGKFGTIEETLYFCIKIEKMSDEIKNTTPELEGMVVSEPAAGYATSSQEPIQFLDDTEFLDYDFREEDFGYPRSLEELQAALDLADEERNDPSKWVSSVDFHQRLEDKYTWLR